MLSTEDNNFDQKGVEPKRVPAWRLTKEFRNKIEKTNIGRYSVKVVHNQPASHPKLQVTLPQLKTQLT